MENKEKIPLFYTHGKIFVWNDTDVMRLRKEYRIVGNLVGCLPRAPRQNIHLGLPLQLDHCEAYLLQQKGICEVVQNKELKSERNEEKINSFKQMRQKSYEEQIPLFRAERIREINQHKDLIIAGKKAKKRKIQEMIDNTHSDKTTEQCDGNEEDGNEDSRNKDGNNGNKDEKEDDEGGEHTGIRENDKTEDQEDSEEMDVEEEPFNIDDIEIPNIKPEQAIVQLFTENSWKSDEPIQYNWQFPQTSTEKLRCQVFMDLWEQNYYLTSGTKFGGDFLVYPGDPALYHSFYIAVCVPFNEKLTALEIVTLGRLGASVRKTVILCSVSEDKVIYTSLQWTGIT